MRDLQQHLPLALLVGEHGAEVDVARLVARRIRIGEVGGQHAETLPVHHQRLLVYSENVLEHGFRSPRWGLEQELCQRCTSRIRPPTCPNRRLDPPPRGQVLPPAGGRGQSLAAHCRERRAVWHVPCLSLSNMRNLSRIRRWLLILGLAAGCPALTLADTLGVNTFGVNTPGVGSTGSEPEDLRALETLAQKEAALQLPPLSDRQRLIAGPIEAHVRLQRCSRPITPVVSAGAHMRDRILVELRCAGASPWHIYVPVRMVGSSPVAIAARAIVAGSILT